MYSISVISQFSAAHMLRGYKGKCENLHGHNWKVEVSISSNKLNKIGMLVDFKEIKKILNEVLEELDHKNLNDIAYFKKINPTSENIAKYVYARLTIHKPRQRQTINHKLKVTVWESDTAYATYSK